MNKKHKNTSSELVQQKSRTRKNKIRRAEKELKKNPKNVLVKKSLEYLTKWKT